MLPALCLPAAHSSAMKQNYLYVDSNFDFAIVIVFPIVIFSFRRRMISFATARRHVSFLAFCLGRPLWSTSHHITSRRSQRTQQRSTAASLTHTHLAVASVTLVTLVSHTTGIPTLRASVAPPPETDPSFVPAAPTPLATRTRPIASPLDCHRVVRCGVWRRVSWRCGCRCCPPGPAGGVE